MAVAEGYLARVGARTDTLLDYERRLWLRRALGVVVPLLLVGAVVALLLRPEPTPALVADVPRQQAAAGEPGVQITATPRPDGSVAVVERVTTARPASTVRLLAPRVGTAGAGFQVLAPRAADVVLRADGRRLPYAPRDVIRPVLVLLPEGTRQIELSYTLWGAAIVSTPSTAGRARIAVGPLTDGSGQGERVVLVGGAGVQTVTCPLLPAAEQLCVTGGSAGQPVGAVAPRSDALFVLQVTLPKA